MGRVVADIGPVTARFDEMALLAIEDESVKLGEDLAIGGGGKEEELADGKVAEEGAEFGEAWPEALAPLDDGMGLVEDQQADGMAGQLRDNLGLGERFGVGDDHLHPTLDLGEEAMPGLGVLPSLELDTRDVCPFEAPALVVHQGEEGVDDDHQSLDKEGREHEAEALAAAGWEDDHRWAMVARRAVFIDDAPDDKLLEGPEVGDVETLVGKGMDVHTQKGESALSSLQLYRNR